MLLPGQHLYPPEGLPHGRRVPPEASEDCPGALRQGGRGAGMLVAGERPRSHGTASGSLPLRIKTPRDLKGEIMLSSHFAGVVELDLQRLLILVTFCTHF